MYIVIGVSAGGALLITIVIIIIISVRRRRDVPKMVENKHPETLDDDDDELKYNVLYVSAGTNNWINAPCRREIDRNGILFDTEVDDSTCDDQKNSSYANTTNKEIHRQSKPNIVTQHFEISDKNTVSQGNTSELHITTPDEINVYAVVNKSVIKQENIGQFSMSKDGETFQRAQLEDAENTKYENVGSSYIQHMSSSVDEDMSISTTNFTAHSDIEHQLRDGSRDKKYITSVEDDLSTSIQADDEECNGSDYAEIDLDENVPTTIENSAILRTTETDNYADIRL